MKNSLRVVNGNDQCHVNAKSAISNRFYQLQNLEEGFIKPTPTGVLDLDPAPALTPEFPSSQSRSSKIPRVDISFNLELGGFVIREVSLPPRQPEEIEEGEFIAYQSRDDWLIPSSPCPLEESPLEKPAMPANPVTPCVKKGDPSLAFKDGMGREMEALPLSSNQATRLDDQSIFNGSPHLKEGENIEERVDQEEDLARKEEEVNNIINYLCDSVTEEIMDKLLDEIIDKDELNLQKKLLSKVILALSSPLWSLTWRNFF
ncbi:hypothetical protein SUGI_0059500 [Cryptomeria japonica]|nr:hypothetical protein SUGI_0059500 [Cryptomeria japonica]